MAEGIDLSGRTLGGYELKTRIGQGGMADVYLASRRFASEYQRDLERRFAVKVMFGTTADAARRFETEMAILLHLNHTNIIRVYDYAVVDGGPYGLTEPFRYFVMDYLDGGTLYERVKQGRLGVREAIGMLRVVASALDFAHSEGILHRDIKPGNVLFDRAGNPVLADFGISKLGTNSSPDSLTTPHRSEPALSTALPCPDEPGRTMDVTSEGIMLGTPPYVAPEAFRGEPLDRRADLYSFGVMTYFALGGQLPFEGETTEALLARILFSEPRSLAEVNPAIPQRAADAVNQMLKKTPAERFPTARDFIRAVERGLGEVPDADHDTLRLPQRAAGDVDTARLTWPERAGWARHGRRGLAALVLGVIGVVALLALLKPGMEQGKAIDTPGSIPTAATGAESPVAQATGRPAEYPAAPTFDPRLLLLADSRLVTNAEYRACLSSGGCSVLPAYPAVFDDPALAGDPVVGVDWFAAQTYCAWRGGRLPSLDEWPALVAVAGDGQKPAGTVREWMASEEWQAAGAQTLAPASTMPVRAITSPDRAMVKPANQVGADIGFRCVGL